MYKISWFFQKRAEYTAAIQINGYKYKQWRLVTIISISVAQSVVESQYD